jgi:hypothetical protein
MGRTASGRGITLKDDSDEVAWLLLTKIILTIRKF